MIMLLFFQIGRGVNRPYFNAGGGARGHWGRHAGGFRWAGHRYFFLPVSSLGGPEAWFLLRERQNELTQEKKNTRVNSPAAIKPPALGCGVSTEYLRYSR